MCMCTFGYIQYSYTYSTYSYSYIYAYLCILQRKYEALDDWRLSNLAHSRPLTLSNWILSVTSFRGNASSVHLSKASYSR